MNSADKWNLHHTRTQHGFLNRLGNCWGIKACADRFHKMLLVSRWVTPWVRRCVILPKKFSILLTPPESTTSPENCTCSWAGPNAGWHPPCQTTVLVICSGAISPHPANAWIPFFSPHQFTRQKLSFSFSFFLPYHILSSWYTDLPREMDHRSKTLVNDQAVKKKWEFCTIIITVGGYHNKIMLCTIQCHHGQHQLHPLHFLFGMLPASESHLHNGHKISSM
jgi:hypothetical protein